VAAACIGWFGMNGTLYSSRAFGEVVPDPSMKKSIDKMLKEEYRKVKTLVEENREAVVAIAEGLLEKDELEEEEIKERIALAEANGRQGNGSNLVRIRRSRKSVMESAASEEEVAAVDRGAGGDCGCDQHGRARARGRRGRRRHGRPGSRTGSVAQAVEGPASWPLNAGSGNSKQPHAGFIVRRRRDGGDHDQQHGPRPRCLWQQTDGASAAAGVAGP